MIILISQGKEIMEHKGNAFDEFQIIEPIFSIHAMKTILCNIEFQGLIDGTKQKIFLDVEQLSAALKVNVISLRYCIRRIALQQNWPVLDFEKYIILRRKI